jgi:uncharacterized phiE125 gp8 family phage protein
MKTMIPILVTGPAVEPLSLEEMRLHLRLDDTQEDDLVGSLLKAARLMLESATRLKFVSQNWRLSIAKVPTGRAIRVPLAPVISVAAVRIFDATGVETLADDAFYRLRRGSEPALVVLEPGFPDAPGGIEVDLVVGFGPAASDVPEPLRHAVRMLVAYWFENRGDEAHERAQLPADVALMIAPYRSLRMK